MPRLAAFAFVLCMTLLFAAHASAQKAPSSGGGASRAPTASSPAPRPTASGTSPAYGRTSPYPYGYPYGYGSEVDPEKAALYDRLHRQERQKQVVKDTDRLLKLTAEYQQEVETAGQAATTEKHLREIEKLAHDVRTALTQ